MIHSGSVIAAGISQGRSTSLKRDFKVSPPDADVDNEGDHECSLEGGSLLLCIKTILTSHLRVSTEFCPGWLSWPAKESARSLVRRVWWVCIFLRKWPQRAV